jgi:hypothetical protein
MPQRIPARTELPHKPHDSPAFRPAAERQARLRALRAKILSGSYDADGKIDGLIEQVVRDAM